LRKDAKVAKGTKDAKKKFLCLLWFSPSIGVNLCQSVDNHAKGAKGTKDAKKKVFLCFL